jgi:hypothetical protein
MVALIYMDDLEKLHCDRVAWMKKVVTSLLAPHLVPYSDYTPNLDVGIILSSFLVMSEETKLNTMRKEGKVKPLVRTNSKHLPLTVREVQEQQNEAQGKENATVKMSVTDRTGFGVVVTKKWGKDSQQAKKKNAQDKGHLPWSQPSNGLQHCDDLKFWITKIISEANISRTRSQMRQEQAAPQAEITKLHEIMCHKDNKKACVPWLTIVSDGGSDETMRNAENLLPLVQLMWDLDLDGVDKFLTCPGHSKMNPDERLNCQAKRPLRSQVILSGNKTKDDLTKAEETVLKLSEGTTFAQEKVRYFIAPNEGTLRFPCNQADLKAYLLERKKHQPDFIRGRLSASISLLWRQSYYKAVDMEEGRPETVEEQNDDTKLAIFWELEQRMIFLQRHIRVINLYMITIAKCKKDDEDICEWCQEHPRQGTYDHTWRKITECDSKCPGGSTCRHAINKDIQEVIQYFNSITPPNLRLPPKCGICRQEGHNRKKCPKNVE